MKKDIFEMLNAGKAEEALILMAEKNNNAELVLADYRNEMKLQEACIISDEEFEEYKKSIIKRISNLHSEPIDERNPGSGDSVSLFLSYNTFDYDHVIRIKNEFNSHNIVVRFDRTDVESGQSIKEFITEQTKGNKAVMLLLSKNSLLSSWVIYESTIAMFDELLNNKRIIPVKLDDAYKDDKFCLEIIKTLDEELSAKRNLAQQHEERNSNPEYIHNDIKRLSDARNNIPKVLSKLRAVAVDSVVGEHLVSTVRKIAKQLMKNK